MFESMIRFALQRWEQQLRPEYDNFCEMLFEYAGRPCTLGILGLQSAGKTTLINACLGYPILPALLTKGTVCPMRIEWGEQPCLTVQMHCGERKREVRISDQILGQAFPGLLEYVCLCVNLAVFYPENLSCFLEEEKGPGELTPQDILMDQGDIRHGLVLVLIALNAHMEAVSPACGTLKLQPVKEARQRLLKLLGLEAGEIESLCLAWNSPLLKEGLCLVDLPGLGSGSMADGRRDALGEIACHWAKHMDVLLCMTTGEVVGGQIQQVLEKIYADDSPGKMPLPVLVVNKAENIVDPAIVIHTAQQLLWPLLPECYLISAAAGEYRYLEESIPVKRTRYWRNIFLPESVTEPEDRLPESGALCGVLPREVNAVREELSREANAVREELSREANVVREELSREANAVREELSREVNAVREELLREANAVREELLREADTEAERFPLASETKAEKRLWKCYTRKYDCAGASGDRVSVSLKEFLENILSELAMRRAREDFFNTFQEYQDALSILKNLTEKDMESLSAMSDQCHPLWADFRQKAEYIISRFQKACGIAEQQMRCACMEFQEKMLLSQDLLEQAVADLNDSFSQEIIHAGMEQKKHFGILICKADSFSHACDTFDAIAFFAPALRSCEEAFRKTSESMERADGAMRAAFGLFRQELTGLLVFYRKKLEHTGCDGTLAERCFISRMQGYAKQVISQCGEIPFGTRKGLPEGIPGMDFDWRAHADAFVGGAVGEAAVVRRGKKRGKTLFLKRKKLAEALSRPLVSDAQAECLLRQPFRNAAEKAQEELDDISYEYGTFRTALEQKADHWKSRAEDAESACLLEMESDLKMLQRWNRFMKG